MLPSCREATGSVIGTESLMMILPVATPPQVAPNPVRKRLAPKHQRAKSYDSTSGRLEVSAHEQQCSIWDQSAMTHPDVCPPIKTMWTPKLEEDTPEPPSQRRKLAPEHADPFFLEQLPASPTPRSADALVADLLMSPTPGDERLDARREPSLHSFCNQPQDATSSALSLERFMKVEGLPPCRGAGMETLPGEDMLFEEPSIDFTI